MLGLVLGLAALSKISDLGLLVVTAFVFVALWRARNNERRVLVQMLKWMFTCAGIVVLLAAWWYARNWMLYGDPFGFNVWIAIAGGRREPATAATLWQEFQGFRISFWGNFGGVNIIAPEWVYLILDVFTLLAGLGLVYGILRRSLNTRLWLPAVWLGNCNGEPGTVDFNDVCFQGRLVFPAVSAVALLLVHGLDQIRPLRLKAENRRWLNLPLPLSGDCLHLLWPRHLH